MNSIDWIGFVGVFLILVAYILNVLGKLESKNLVFILLNLIGATMACIASLLIEYLPFVLLEGVWAIVAFVSLLKYKRAK